MGRFQSCPELGGGRWSHETRGGSGATLSQEAGAGAVGHVAVPELPRQEAGARATGHVAVPELPSQDAGARATRHVGAHERPFVMT
jgi:hypothetical protein